MTDTNILECGHAPTADSGIGTGYGIDADGNRSCYACCADHERENMIATGRASLYLSTSAYENTHRTYRVTDWAGELEFPVTRYKHGRHNIAGTRIDVYFVGPDRHWWHGVSYGGNTQIVHCKRTEATINR